MNEPQKHAIKPESKDYTLYDSMYIKHLEKTSNTQRQKSDQGLPRVRGRSRVSLLKVLREANYLSISLLSLNNLLLHILLFISSYIPSPPQLPQNSFQILCHSSLKSSSDFYKRVDNATMGLLLANSMTSLTRISDCQP